MPKHNVNAHNHLAVMLLDLRRHFQRCDECRLGRKAESYDEFCDYGKQMIVDIAIRWERNIPGRLAVHKTHDPWIYPCPNPNAHGPAYALTAEACIVQSIVDQLF